MSEQQVLRGVEVSAVEGLINAVKKKPDLSKSKFRASKEWIEGGHNRTRMVVRCSDGLSCYCHITEIF